MTTGQSGADQGADRERKTQHLQIRSVRLGRSSIGWIQSTRVRAINARCIDLSEAHSRSFPGPSDHQRRVSEACEPDGLTTGGSIANLDGESTLISGETRCARLPPAGSERAFYCLGFDSDQANLATILGGEPTCPAVMQSPVIPLTGVVPDHPNVIFLCSFGTSQIAIACPIRNGSSAY